MQCARDLFRSSRCTSLRSSASSSCLPPPPNLLLPFFFFFNDTATTEIYTSFPTRRSSDLMGGIRAAFLAPLDSRIRAAVIGLAGGDLPYIIAHSKENGIVHRRTPYLERHGITQNEFEQELRATLACDPLTVAPSIDPHKVLLVLATFDACVPSKKGFELRRAIGKPETIIVPTGHYTALLYIPYVKPAGLR